MPFRDMPLAELEAYRPAEVPPADLRQRWDETLADARRHPVDVRRTPVDTGLRLVEVEDVTFAGFGGDPVKAWLVRPAHRSGDLPVVVEYNGYGGGRGLPHERLFWASAGYAYLLMDTRGQGATWGSGGETADLSGGGAAAGPALPGSMTRGVLDFDTYYYRRLITDAVRLLDAVRTIDGLDLARVVAAGGSQGGGLAVAATALGEGVAATLADVPFLCHVTRGIEIAEQDPYQEIARYLAVHRRHVEPVMRTLSYVDGLHLAPFATVPALFSVGLRDDVCPPSTVYATRNAWGGPSEIRVYPYNHHEGGQAYQQVEQLRFLDSLWSGR